MRYIVNGLKDNNTLRVIDLSNKYYILGYNGITTEAGKLILGMLAKNTKLREIDLSTIYLLF